MPTSFNEHFPDQQRSALLLLAARCFDHFLEQPDVTELSVRKQYYIDSTYIDATTWSDCVDSLASAFSDKKILLETVFNLLFCVKSAVFPGESLFFLGLTLKYSESILDQLYKITLELATSDNQDIMTSISNFFGDNILLSTLDTKKYLIKRLEIFVSLATRIGNERYMIALLTQPKCHYITLKSNTPPPIDKASNKHGHLQRPVYPDQDKEYLGGILHAIVMDLLLVDSHTPREERKRCTHAYNCLLELFSTVKDREVVPELLKSRGKLKAKPYTKDGPSVVDILTNNYFNRGNQAYIAAKLLGHDFDLPPELLEGWVKIRSEICDIHLTDKIFEIKRTEIATSANKVDHSLKKLMTLPETNWLSQNTGSACLKRYRETLNPKTNNEPGILENIMNSLATHFVKQ